MTLDITDTVGISKRAEHAFEVMVKTYEHIDTISDDNELMIWLGVLIDRWAAEHGYTAEQMHEMLSLLIETHEMVNSELGPWQLHPEE